jgi:hypothetical protein
MKTNRRSFFQDGAILGAGLTLGSLGLFAKNKKNPAQNASDDIFDIIRNRRSVRKFKSTPVPKEHLTMILEAANQAPSPSNRQAWKFLVIREQIKEECIEIELMEAQKSSLELAVNAESKVRKNDIMLNMSEKD